MLTPTESTSWATVDHAIHFLNPQPRKTKIVCTVGPATASPDKLRALIAAGANVIRLNFSHSDHAWHGRVLEAIRAASASAQCPVAVLQDLCGPKIRVSRLAGENVRLAPGDRVTITTDARLAQDERIEFDIASTYAGLVSDVRLGDRLLLDDGRLELEVVELLGDRIAAQVVRGGPLSVGKGINLPGIPLSTPSLTDKDWRDLEWGLANGVDFIALSFVRRASDLAPVRRRLEETGSSARLIAKIERPEAVDHLDQILALADGLMVARGDLGLETDLSRVPLLQKRLIERCRAAGKPVITATQMLESMIHDPTPTRAEVSDVANAIYDGTDAIMLSGETATGKHPEAAVEVLHKVALVTETDLSDAPELRRRGGVDSAVAALAEGAAVTARTLAARRVAVYSQSGLSARLMARYRLPMPVVAVTNEAATYRQLSLSYGVQPVLLPEVTNLAQLLAHLNRLSLARGWAEVGDTLVVVSSLAGRDGHVDTLHVHQVQA